MADSRIPGPLGLEMFGLNWPGDPLGPLGVFGPRRRRDTPGPVGINDWGAHLHTAQKEQITAPVTSCACGRDITADELCKIFIHQKRAVCQLYLPALNASFKSYKISSCLRKAHFIAQVGHESGELNFTSEILPKGKKESDFYDGYMGRGLLQLTWKKSYEEYGKAVGHDFTGTHRSELEQPKWATDSAAWFWTTHAKEDLDIFADKNDFLAITSHVNGGFNGFDDRLKHLIRAFKVFGVRGCKVANIGKRDYLPFGESAICNEWLHAFAWGAWNDPNAKKKGIAAKSGTERKAGYARYLVLKNDMVTKMTVAKKNKLQAAHHYGFTGTQMDELATAGCK